MALNGGNFDLGHMTDQELIGMGFAFDPLGAAEVRAAGKTSTSINTIVDNIAYKAEQVKATTGKAGVGSAAGNIYADMQPMGTVFPELTGVNPYYIEGAPVGVNTNCASCVNAAQARLTGRDPAAVASPSAGYANQNTLLPSAPFGFGEVTTPRAVISTLQQAGDGAARPLIVQQNGVDHVINAVNRGGAVYFIDSQMGMIVTLQPNVVVRLGNAP